MVRYSEILKSDPSFYTRVTLNALLVNLLDDSCDVPLSVPYKHIYIQYNIINIAYCKLCGH